MQSDCIIWQGEIDRHGYGKRGHKLAHRMVYERDVAPIPEGMEIDHLCRNRACVNPDHLEPVTHAENMRRSGPAIKSHCSNGHPYDAVNTYIRPAGTRDCRACNRDRVRRYLAKKKAA